MPTTSPATFLAFVAEHADLLVAMLEQEGVDQSELSVLVSRFRKEQQASTEHIVRRLMEYQVLRQAAHADTELELAAPIAELLRWLLNRQRLAGAAVLQGHLAHLTRLQAELRSHVESGDHSSAVLALKEADGAMERLRELSGSNREAIVSEVQQLRSAGAISAVERFRIVRRIWEQYLEPLSQLVQTDGEMERCFRDLRGVVAEGEEKFLGHGPLYRAFGRSIARLTRLKRTLLRDHHAAMQEVAPLYHQLRRDSTWTKGAASMLEAVRAGRLRDGDFARLFPLGAWRLRGILSNERLLAELVNLRRYEPPSPPFLPADEPPPVLALIRSQELEDALRAAAPVQDVLEFILRSWAEMPLRTVLKAYAAVLGGTFGDVDVPLEAEERAYVAAGARLFAVPVALNEVVVDGR